MGAVTRRRAAAVLVLALLALAMPAVTAAAAPSFGVPTATAKFLQGIDVTEPATIPAGVRRVEALVHTGGGTRIAVEAIPLPPAGATTLSFHFATPSGSLIPNTVVDVHFRVTMDDGSTVDGPVATVRYEDTRYDWKTLEGRVVRVHWTEGSDAFGQRALAIGEKAIDDVSALLGVQETDPIDFYIYADRTAFYDVLGPGSRENVGGSAFTEIRTLIANIAPSNIDDAWVGIVIPHELTHLVFDTATRNPYHFPPRWLNEGIAVYLSQGYDAGDRSAVERAARDGTLMPLVSLEGQFPTTAERFGLAYSESVSSIDHLVQQYGRDALVKLVRTYADGVTDDEAFKAAIGVDVAGFQAGWFESLGVPEPSPAGPQPDPSGPLPADWQGAAATAGPAGSAVASQSSGGAPGAPAPGGPTMPVLLLAAVVVVLAAVILLASRRRRPPAVAWVEPAMPAPRPPDPETPASLLSSPADGPAESTPADSELTPDAAPSDVRLDSAPAATTPAPLESAGEEPDPQRPPEAS
jgi:hypothetical protein